MNADVEARDRKKLVAVVLGLSAVIGLMLLVFVLPSVNSGPHELKLGITGPAAATEQISTSLEASKQGAFDTREFADADACVTRFGIATWSAESPLMPTVLTC